MKKTVVAVFAHPDDEAFGPSGTLALLAQEYDVYLLCVTGGEAGKNSLKNSEKKLNEIRKKELSDSAKILGIKKIFCLGFKDGTLSNNIYHKLAAKIEKKLTVLKPKIVITFEPQGVSGHIDHITVCFVTTFVINRLKSAITLYYYCVLENDLKKLSNDYFIYFPKGYKKNQIDWQTDVGKVWQTKIKAMLAHKSQQHDGKVIIEALNKLPKKEYFLKFKP